jgi:two-component system, OmpR family, KDP operon response regulator KdpE
MNNKERILIVDDEPKLVHLVREVLSATGYEVLAAISGEQAVEMAALEQPDLIILDIVLLGDLDGFEVARRIREFSDIPIVMLTAKIRETDKLRGFEVGVDDYITKPFSTKELVARIRAVLKRSPVIAPVKRSLIQCGELRIDFSRRSVKIGEHDVHLTPTEFDLLKELALHSNQVLFHEQLLTTVWGPEYRKDVDYLRTYVHFLRKKIEVDPSAPEIIINIQGIGYMFASPETSQ